MERNEFKLARALPNIGLVGDRDQVRRGSASLDIQLQFFALPLLFHRDDQLENDLKIQN